MEGYYKREKDKNYLIFENQMEEESYKYKMLRYNRISVLLDCRVYCVDNVRRIQYDISSKQSLQRICEKKHLNQKQFQKILGAIQKLIQELERYFLRLDEVFLKPEHIYTDMETFEVYFCYYPHKEITQAEEEFHSLAEYLINHLDYEDKQVIEQGYALYRYTLQENYDILKSIQKTVGNQKKAEILEEALQESYEESEDEYSQEKNVSKAAEGGFFNQIMNRFKGEVKSVGIYETEKDKWNKESIVEIEDEKEEHYGHTMLLKEVQGKSMHYLVCLSEGGYQDFTIDKFPFVIGKGREWADGVIPHNLVSRIHAQFEEEEGEIFITDLNSTNGTGVNDEVLEANQTVQLKSGDVIHFSEVYYRFV